MTILKRVLIACEYTGCIRDTFRKAGFEAWSCDFEPSTGIYNEFHLEQDCQSVLSGIDGIPWTLMIAHPPCTYLCNSGISWLYHNKVIDKNRWNEMINGANFFKLLLNTSIPHIAIENPIMHRYAKHIVGENYSQLIQPYQFGHPETKATCLWLHNLPLLKPTKLIKENIKARVHNVSPSSERWRARSRTLQGIADAMVSQWSFVLH